ncbi:transporter substrate-binding domain-containing protein [Bacillus lacus]|uniref:Transporter substrate-binding domain-containing protein n=1 Tax=Metabacillus lacus TaxID=1983721 RepID=A0A7X2IYJ3_9BACI|nr:amino acid ABC transporter substrate-binding protein [Metabacillus lacus]MRX71503.1 transporter substrate-binding domain-containing protein [Metabacillus lacus]
MKKYLLIALTAFFMFALAACGTNNNGAEQENQQENTAEENASEENTAGNNDEALYNQVKNDGVLRVGTEGTYPPFTFHDESGKLTGFDVEIAKEVAKRLGVEAEFSETQWDAMFAGLDSKRFDMIANQVGIREDRIEKYDFSDAYISSAAVLVTNKDNTEIQNFEDIDGKQSAQSLTSNYGTMAEELGAELVGVEGFNQAIELLVQGRVDTTINDKLSVLDYLNQKPNAPIQIVAESEDASESGLMFRKGSGKLVEEVNKALAEMKEDGTYASISEKWFGEDVSE